MTDNPFDSPKSEPQQPPESSSGQFPPVVILAVALFLAVATGLSFSAMVAGTSGSDQLMFYVFFPSPVIALMVVGIAKATNALRSFDWMLSFRVVLMVFLTGFAGYIAFATTCCCANVIVFGDLPPGQARSAGIVSLVSTMFGCAVAYGLLHLYLSFKTGSENT